MILLTLDSIGQDSNKHIPSIWWHQLEWYCMELVLFAHIDPPLLKMIAVGRWLALSKTKILEPKLTQYSFMYTSSSPLQHHHMTYCLLGLMQVTSLIAMPSRQPGSIGSRAWWCKDIVVDEILITRGMKNLRRSLEASCMKFLLY